MLKTIYSRIIFVSLIVSTTLVVITGIVLFSVFGNFFVREQRELLLMEAGRINELTTFYLDNRTPPVEKLYRRSIDDSARRINGIIYIIDSSGNMVSSRSAEHHFNNKVPDIETAEAVLGGNTIVELGDMNGLFKSVYLTVGLPLEIGGKTIGATFLSVPVPVVDEYKYFFLNSFFLTVGVIFFIATLVLFFYSKKISNPIKQMNHLSKEIAKGNFDMRVSVSGKTDIAELAENFNEMADALKNLEDMRSSFISNVSHELRTPMTTITGFVEGVLDDTIAEEDKEKYLRIVLDEAKRLARLVSELLMLSRIDAGTLQLNLKKFDINELIRISVIRFEKQITDKNLDIEINFEHDSEFVTADKDSISRVMTNLIENAIKFNIDGGYIKIAVKPECGKVSVSIENSGIGIDKDEINHVFERFYKTDKSRSLDKKGMGLGLYMVNNIIANHGEKIYVDSEKEKWTRFEFTLKKS